jgi:hypothetical protein
MRRWQKITAVAGIGALLFPRPAKALFGEDIPFLIQLVNQSIQDYRLARQAYDEMKRAGYYMTHINVRQLLFQSVNTATRNVYGETINWPMAMNNGSNVSGAWSRATVQVNPASWYRDDLAAQSALANVEILDAAATNAMTIHGQALQQSKRLAGSIQNPTIQDQLELQEVGNSADTHACNWRSPKPK